MTIQEVLLPLFLEVILTFALLFWLAPSRTIDFSSGVARPENVALREPNCGLSRSKTTAECSRQVRCGSVSARIPKGECGRRHIDDWAEFCRGALERAIERSGIKPLPPPKVIEAKAEQISASELKKPLARLSYRRF